MFLTHFLKIALSIFFILSSSLASAGAFEQLFAPKAELWGIWQTHNAQSLKHIEHQAWNMFLKNNVRQVSDGITRIAYADVTIEERSRLRSYIDAMQKVNVSNYNRDEQLAFWINLYNAVTVDIVLAHYPVDSIRDIDISPGLFTDGPWGKKLINIENETLSLNDIEHRILRPIWKDARIHFVVNCASIGCPNLQPQAFTSRSINMQMDLAAKQYIAHPRGVTFTDEGVVVSSIFSWFQQDFGETEADVIKYIQQYAGSVKHKKLEGMIFFSGDGYDWALNDVTEPLN